MTRPAQLPAPISSPPEVAAVLDRSGRTVVVRCPFCRRRHVHGVPEGDYGLRGSHCHDRPSQSYMLVPAPREGRR